MEQLNDTKYDRVEPSFDTGRDSLITNKINVLLEQLGAKLTGLLKCGDTNFSEASRLKIEEALLLAENGELPEEELLARLETQDTVIDDFLSDLKTAKSREIRSLSQSAVDYLNSAERGIPLFISREMRKIAQENDIEILSEDTPEDVINKFKTKKANFEKENAAYVETKETPPEKESVVDEPLKKPTGDDGPTQKEDDSVTTETKESANNTPEQILKKFEAPITVSRGDRIWSIVANVFQGNPVFQNMKDSGKDVVLGNVLRELKKLPREELIQRGFIGWNGHGAGDIHNIFPENVLDLSGLFDENKLNDMLDSVRALSASDNEGAPLEQTATNDEKSISSPLLGNAFSFQ